MLRRIHEEPVGRCSRTPCAERIQVWLEVVRFHVAEQMKGQVAQLPNAKPKALKKHLNSDSKGSKQAGATQTAIRERLVGR